MLCRDVRPAATAAILATVLFGCDASRPVNDAPGSAASASAPGGSIESPTKRGEYLVTIMGCGDCHTPLKMGPNGPEPDATRRLSGHPEDLKMTEPPALGDSPWGWVGAATNTAFAGPWGVSYATNLTPEETSGLGPWNEEMFVRSLKTGKHWGEGRAILPPMPWSDYAHMTDEDLKAIWAYLRTIPPVKNNPPASEPAPPPAAPSTK